MKYFNILFLAFIMLVILSCKKEFLDKKPDKSLVVPVSLADFQALMDKYDDVNKTPGFIEVATDDFYIPNGDLQSQYNTIKNSYLWNKELYDGEDNFMHQDWSKPYSQIFRMNVVLDGLEKFSELEKSSKYYKEVKGSALFYRSFHFFSLVQTFSKGFNPLTSSTDLGVPLKLSSDVNMLPSRSSVEETYQQIINDLKQSADLLPEEVIFKTRPSSIAAHAMLSRVYLSMSDFTNAEVYATKVLEKKSSLINFNSLPNLNDRFPRALPNSSSEIIFYSIQNPVSILYSTSAIVLPELYNSYENADLRKKMFFLDRGNNLITFKGSYDGTGFLFSGLAVDEILLIKSECLARKNDLIGAMENLNHLLKNRYTTSGFVPKTADNKEKALKLIQMERRKELIFRGIRWGDIKRINLEGDEQIILNRTYDGIKYTLSPNSNRYAFQIPNTEIMYNPHIIQNNRD